MSRVDLVVPTIPGREKSLERLLRSLEGRGVRPIVVSESETCGAGWIEGLRRSDAPYVGLFADDLEVVGDRFPGPAIEVVDRGDLPCPRVYRPDGTIESQGGDMNAPGHVVARPRKNGSLVDFTTVPFLSREQADRIGMIPTQYACDTWVSYRGSLSGYTTLLAHGYDLVHHSEAVGRGAGMEQGERDATDTETMLEQLAYASHLPALRTVLDRVDPKSVLEIGSGHASTRAFLDWPSVRKVDSVEENRDWREKIREELPDERLEFLSYLPASFADYDLVFVDGPDEKNARAKMIEKVLSKPHPIVVVHDAEQAEYRKAISKFNGVAEYFVADEFTFLDGKGATCRPADRKETAVVW